MAFQPVNLAQIYGAVDASRANQRSARMEELQMQRYQQQEDDRMALRDAFRGAIDPSGNLDEKVLLSSLWQVAPEKAMEVQQSLSQRSAEAAKLKTETAKAELEQKKATAAYLRDRLATVTDDASYQAVLQEARDLGAGFVDSAPQQFNPDWLRSQVVTADKFLEQMTPKYERVDLGGRVQVVDINPFTNPAIKGTQFDKTLTPDAKLTDERTRSEGALNRATTIRGQNLTAETARLGREVTKRGQDITAAKQNAPTKTQLSASAQKELFEADELAQASANAVGMLKEALTLNNKAYSGYGAKERAILRSNLPGNDDAADATINLDNLMTGQALESLKAVFGGMPTEGERKILLDMQASADKTPKQRKAILDRAVQAAERRLKFNKSKADALRKGSYFTDGVPIQETQPASTGVIDFGSLK
jgi:hypothetical protein